MPYIDLDPQHFTRRFYFCYSYTPRWYHKIPGVLWLKHRWEYQKHRNEIGKVW